MPSRGAALVLGLALAATACAPAAPADGPGATIAQALDRLQAKDLDGLRALACEGQEHAIRDQLDLPEAVGAELLPGLDVDALVDAVQLDVSGLEAGEPAIEGEVAQVPISGDLKVTFDAESLKPIVGPALEAQGRDLTDEELDALLTSLEAYGQSIPVNGTVRLVREDGDWKVCQLEPDVR
jgi:hypothetical protein